MNQELPSDALTKPTKRAPWILGGVGAVALITAGVIAGPSIASQLNPAPKPNSTLSPYVSPALTPDELASIQSGADAQHATIAAEEAAAEEAAAEAAAQAAADQAAKSHHAASGNGGLPAGAIDPLNEFGSPDTTLCASGTASDNSSGVAICD